MNKNVLTIAVMAVLAFAAYMLFSKRSNTATPNPRQGGTGSNYGDDSKAKDFLDLILGGPGKAEDHEAEYDAMASVNSMNSANRASFGAQLRNWTPASERIRAYAPRKNKESIGKLRTPWSGREGWKGENTKRPVMVRGVLLGDVLFTPLPDCRSAYSDGYKYRIKSPENVELFLSSRANNMIFAYDFVAKRQVALADVTVTYSVSVLGGSRRYPETALKMANYYGRNEPSLRNLTDGIIR